MAFCKLASLRHAFNAFSVNRHIATIKQSTKERLKDLHVPLKPKKPLTPYFRFMRDFRKDCLKQDPKVKLTKIVQEGAAKWGTVANTIKDKYAQEYEHERADYMVKMAEYNKLLTPEQRETILEAKREKKVIKQKRDHKKKIRENDKPKRPMGPYMHFLMEHAKTSSKSLFELTYELKGHWQAMPEAEKKRYTQLFEEDKKRYESEMAVWERRMIAEGNTDLVRQSVLQAMKPSRLSKSDKPKKQ